MSFIQSTYQALRPQPSAINVKADGAIVGQVQRFKTRGDGSCAFHALLGTPNRARVYQCDADKERAIFAVDLQKQYDKKKLSPSIREELKDIFLHFDQAPAEMKVNPKLITKWSEQLHFYNEVTKFRGISRKVKEEIRKGIIDSFIEVSFPHYLKHIVNKKSYISPNELCALAETRNKVVNLFTKMRNEGVSGMPEQFNSKGRDQVTIFLSDTGLHYERARFGFYE